MVSKKNILYDLGKLTKTERMNVKISTSIDDSLKYSYGICILTEWDEFKKIDFKKASSKLIKPILFIDGRNIIDLDRISDLFKNIMSLDT